MGRGWERKRSDGRHETQPPVAVRPPVIGGFECCGPSWCAAWTSSCSLPIRASVGHAIGASQGTTLGLLRIGMAGGGGAEPVWRQMSRHTRWSGKRSEEHTSELQSLLRMSYAVFCLKQKKQLQDIGQKRVWTKSRDNLEHEY